ncbi:MAG: YeaH/YhbH family protein [Pseudomonadota bacterium]
MSYILDRRLNSKNKSAVNRARFLKRYRGHIEEAVREAVTKRSITDMDRGEEISIPTRDISEPVFSHGNGGRRSVVHPGNKEFVAGDRIKRPSGGGSGGGGGQASKDGEGLDDFVFQLSRKEFLDFMFADLELPNMIKEHLKGDASQRYVHAGYSNDGVPSKLAVVRSLRAAKARRLALCSGPRRKLREAKEALAQAEEDDDEVNSRRLQMEVDTLRRRIDRVPFIDTIDLRYNLHIKEPVPTSQAVMFCLMDVSGSMDQHIKELAKRYFLLLYLFLEKNYERTDIVFIRHHTTAKEVDEQEFFYSRETGGTVVSSALTLAADIVDQRYPVNEWNIYMAQASDGDNWGDDSPKCRALLEERLLPLVQYFTYVEITRRDHQALWQEYEKVGEKHAEIFAQQQIRGAEDIYPVFRELFKKKVAA